MNKNFYYFSKSKLKFVEIRNFYRKFVFLIFFSAFILSFFIFGTYFVISEYLNPDSEVKSLQIEKQQLISKLNDFANRFKELDHQLNELTKTNNDLRLVANLEPLSEEERNIGLGGYIFEEINITSSEDVNQLVSTLNSYVNDLKVKINLERSNYEEIENTFNYNSKLFDAIPAIKPSDGRYGDKFGLRFHPILKIRRMHNGIDIITNRGTEVYASGGGRVEFVGRKGGLGNTIIINHGFGYKTFYGHLSGFKVKEGIKVSRGDLIALTGSSGQLATGPHLHYEVYHNGIALDPRNFIYDDVKIFEINPEAVTMEE